MSSSQLNTMVSNHPSNLVESTAKAHAMAGYANLIRRRWIYIATIVPTSVLIAVFIAFVLPKSYRATGTIMLEPSSIPQEMISSTVRRQEDVPEFAQQQLELVRRRVMTPDKLLQLVQQIDPYPRLQISAAQKAEMIAESTTVERVDPITLKPLEESTAFSVSYDSPQPRLAAAVAEKLVELYLTYNRATRVEQATATYEFLQSQAKDLETQMVEQEQKLAGFKARYGNALPEMQQHNLLEIDRAQHDLEETQRQILVSEEKESELQLQLNDLSPLMTNAVSDWRKELAKLQTDLADAQQKYTPQHPEVKRLKRAIAELVAQGSAGLQQNAQKPDNPEYLAVKSQLDSVRRQLATLHTDEARQRAKISSYEQDLSTQPNVEREYTGLQRDYDNARARYEDLQTKMKSAALARTMEVQQKGEKFILLQSPKAPRRPYYPNRLGIILLGFLLGCGLAFGCVAAADAADPTVRGTADLQEIMGITAIGAIPTLLNPSDRRRRSLRWASALTVFTAACVFVLATVYLNR